MSVIWAFFRAAKPISQLTHLNNYMLFCSYFSIVGFAIPCNLYSPSLICTWRPQTRKSLSLFKPPGWLHTILKLSGRMWHCPISSHDCRALRLLLCVAYKTYLGQVARIMSPASPILAPTFLHQTFKNLPADIQSPVLCPGACSHEDFLGLLKIVALVLRFWQHFNQNSSLTTMRYYFTFTR